mgnify:CR=1 FL=1
MSTDSIVGSTVASEDFVAVDADDELWDGEMESYDVDGTEVLVVKVDGEQRFNASRSAASSSGANGFGVAGSGLAEPVVSALGEGALVDAVAELAEHAPDPAWHPSQPEDIAILPPPPRTAPSSTAMATGWRRSRRCS